MTSTQKTAFIFPGQGAQSVGMGHDVYQTFSSARTIFEEADTVLGFSLSRLCFEGPEEELRLTINAQPALVTVSYALLTVAREMGDGVLPSPVFMAGHSLGEYTALLAAGTLDFATAVYLARERGRLMHEAGQMQNGGMVAILGLEEDILKEVCASTDTIIANYNSPGQLVISGPMDSLPGASEMAQARGASRAVPLQVSGAFHSPLMKPAQDGLTEILAGINFHEPVVPIVANTTAKPIDKAEALRTELKEQLCSAVQWQRSVEFMVDSGIATFYEIGPGKVLSGLNKRINKEIVTYNISDVESLRNLAG